MAKIVVVGSFNMDLVVRMPAIPRPGETLLGGVFATYPGGKGANQAVAAARLGGEVTMIGRVGADAFGDQLLAVARSEGIDTRFVGIDPDAATGVALIEVDAQGQNSIAVASGANFTLTAAEVAAAFAQIERVDLVVMPLETPMDTIVTAAELAHEAGARVVLTRRLPNILHPSYSKTSTCSSPMNMKRLSWPGSKSVHRVTPARLPHICSVPGQAA